MIVMHLPMTSQHNTVVTSIQNSFLVLTMLLYQVRFIFWQNARPVVDIIFNGQGSTIENWFQRDKVMKIITGPNVIRSTTYNYWSFMGHVRHGLHLRHFFINFSYAGCGNDWGLLAVMDRFVKSESGVQLTHAVTDLEGPTSF